MISLSLEEKAYIRVLHGVLVSSETIEENNEKLANMKTSPTRET